MSKQELTLIINEFISKKEVSIALANEIEVALDDSYPDDEYMQDTVDMLATYRPGGGDFLYDEEAVIARLQKVIKML